MKMLIARYMFSITYRVEKIDLMYFTWILADSLHISFPSNLHVIDTQSKIEISRRTIIIINVVDLGMLIAITDPDTTIIMMIELMMSSFCRSGFFHRSFVIEFS
jgi:hypothetical protein